MKKRRLKKYAKNKAIDFAEWLLGQPYIAYGDSEGTKWTDKEFVYTSDELFEVYQKNITDTATACR